MVTDNLKSDAVFARIKDRLAVDPEKGKQINAIFLYRITTPASNGKPIKQWTLDLKKATVYEGPPTDGAKPDTTLSINDNDLLDITLGKLNPQIAFMKGKLKITGNITLTQKLIPLLKTEAKL